MNCKRNSVLASITTAAFLALPADGADALYVAPGGKDGAPGTREAPVSLKRAVARASEPDVREIVLLGGEYPTDNLNVRAPLGADPAEWPPLTIRAAEGEEVVLCHSVHVREGEPVEGLPGVYRTSPAPPGEPNVWERDTRIRYVSLTTLGSVAAHPASCFADPEDDALYLHTSDGKPPQSHRVFFGLGVSNGRALGVYRPNTTISDLTFRDCIRSTHARVGPERGQPGRQALPF